VVLPVVGDHQAGRQDREHDQAQPEGGAAQQQWPSIGLVCRQWGL
jgi:hypothetical protein